jgi:subtilase family serine protease
MRRILFPAAPAARRLAAGLAAVAALTLVGGAAAAAPCAPAAAGPAPASPAGTGLGARAVCPAAPPGQAACLSVIDSGLHWDGRTWTTGPAPAARPRTAPRPAAQSASAAPAPYMAADLQAAYHLPSALLGGRQTIAIVDAYDDPTAASDLDQYRQANGLPVCDASFPCFTKVNQDGKPSPLPPPAGSAGPQSAGWDVEESLDLDMASAICPNCKIILVEADDSTFANLAAAENEAARLGANVISNSYAAIEFAGDTIAYAAAYDHPGIAITAGSGDSGFGVNWPADLGSVTAVGGTSLFRAPGTARGWAETAWADAGSGCSAYVAKPAWQHDPLCSNRTVADVAAVADPNTPVAVYDTFSEQGWIAVGGTSVATPIIAGIYALAGNAATAGPGASWVYAHRQYLNDVTTGGLFDANVQANGDCGGSYLCTAGPGYDGPTGLGTPDGIGAF